MPEALAAEACADADLVQQGDRGRLEDTGAHPGLDIGATARLDDHGVDALKVQQVGEGQPGGARADDADLCAHETNCTSPMGSPVT